MRRTIRSFVRREGRLTVGQEKALTEYWPMFGIEPSEELFNFEQIFGRDAPVILEIGFGNGKSLLQIAQQSPELNFLGIEVYKAGVGGLLRDLAVHNVQNVRVMCIDAIETLKKNVPDGKLAGLLLYFPDPWHKKRHNKRRIVSAEFIELVAQKLQPGGYLHMATDWQPYAEQMLEIATASSQLVNKAGDQQYMPRPETRPLTKFEQRGQKLGHGVWDLVFLKR